MESGLAGVLNSTAPIFVILISVAVLRRAMPWRRVAGALTGLAGVVLIMGPGVLAGLGQQAVAQAAVLAGAVLYALGALNGGRFAALPPVVTAAGTMVVASAVLIPAACLIEQPWSLRPAMLPLTAGLALGLFSTALALFLYFRLVVTLGPLAVASQAYMRAGIAVALGMIFLGEVLAPMTALGIAVALGGVVLINWPRRGR